uniref:NB-ARC domain-containing protein n=1 Tax=Oryza glumipatula TaxID=40148 RepID=A0A0E0BM44_9ORYZ
MPCLRRLDLWDCPKLRALPPQLGPQATKLKELLIRRARCLKTVEDLPFLSGYLSIGGCEGLERVSNLPQVREMLVGGCRNLRHVEELGGLEKLLLYKDMKEISQPYWVPGLQELHRQLHGDELEINDRLDHERGRWEAPPPPSLPPPGFAGGCSGGGEAGESRGREGAARLESPPASPLGRSDRGPPGMEDSAVHNWIFRLKDVMYDADDIIDLASFEGNKLLNGHSSSPRKTTACSALSPLSFFSNIWVRHEIGDKIRKLNQKLAEIEKDKIFATLESTQLADKGSTSELRKTSHIVEPNLVGKEIVHACRKLVSLVVAHKEDKAYKLAMVGTGGVGKTTLAQKDYTPVSVLKQLLRIMEVQHAQEELAGELQSKLELAIKDKSFFLVLDDLWHSDVWTNVLRTPLHAATSGIILITTRQDTVAREIGVEEAHHVDLMSPAVGWELLWKSMNIQDEKEVQNLRDIGIEIVQKCGGLPLAIKVTARKDTVVIPFTGKEEIKLRTFTTDHQLQGVDNTFFMRLTHLRVLDLRDSLVQTIPDYIGSLIHLRMFDLDGTNISCLPESIGSLQNLLILNLKSCKSLHFLPLATTQLYNLRRLGLAEGFPIGGASDNTKTQDGWNLEELADLSKLRRLHVMKLERAIKDKSFFLVLDDLWHSDVWTNVLRTPLHAATSGIILITTQQDTVAREIGVEEAHRVDLMSPAVGWELLWKSMNIQDEKEVQNLRDIGIEIVQKCGGLPLAIKVTARVLASKDKTENEWNTILAKNVWSRAKLPKEISGALYLSYDDLPHHLKQCFLYCILFPEDWFLKRDELIMMWVAEGFVEVHKDQLLEDTAKEYYYELISRNLLQPVDTSFDQSICKMHDLIRQLACYLSREECYIGDLKPLVDNTICKL